MTEPRTNEELLEHMRALLREGQAQFLRKRRAPLDLAPRAAGSERASLLATAERELPITYRAEVARLLHDESKRVLFALPGADTRLHRCLTADQEVELRSREDIRQRARRWREVAPAEVADDELLELLSACIDDHEESAAVAARLALASLELAPRAEARITAAVAFYLDGQAERAREMLGRLLSTQPQGPLKSLILEQLAWFDDEEGDPERSMQRYRRSFEACPGRPAPLIAWLAGALRLGDREQALAAAQALLEVPLPSEEVLASCLRRLAADPQAELPDTRLARELAEEHGPLARRIVRAVLGE